MTSGVPPWVCHLVFDAGGIVRMCKGSPALRAGERAIRIKLHVPVNAFQRKFPEATIDVPEEAVIEPAVEIMPADGAVPQSAPQAGAPGAADA